MKIHPNKIDNVIRLDPESRYGYSIREIVKNEKVWLVTKNDSWMTIVDSHGDEILPIWPHLEVAERCLFAEMKEDGGGIEYLGLDEFINLCLPQMLKIKALIGVFYGEDRIGKVSTAEQFLRDLSIEIEDME